MDPVSLIVAALVAGAGAVGAGAAAGVADAAKDAVASLYGRLKAALLDRASGDSAAGKTLERHAGNPAGYEAPVRDLVTESGADQDGTIVALARELVEAADPDGAQVGKYNVHVRNSRGVVIGDHADVTQTFN